MDEPVSTWTCMPSLKFKTVEVEGLPYAHKRKKGPVAAHIVDDHNDVLPHIYRAIGSKRVPPCGLTLLHFDSHPDAGLPLDLTPEDVGHPPTLFDKVSISEFIMPAVYAGHISHFVWVKPPWALQFHPSLVPEIVYAPPDGKAREGGPDAADIVEMGALTGADPRGSNVTFEAWVGVHNGVLRIGCDHVYFDDVGAPRDELENAKRVLVQVVTLPSRPGECPHQGGHTGPDPAVPFVIEVETTPYVIVDVCLDFFSVANPFLVDTSRDFSLETYRVIQAVWDYDTSGWNAQERREALELFNSTLETLLKDKIYLGPWESVWEYFSQSGIIGIYQDSYPNPDHVCDLFRLFHRTLLAMDDTLASRIMQRRMARYPPPSGASDQQASEQYVEGVLDWEDLMLAGEMHDLPHHHSTPEEITSLLEGMQALLASPGLPETVLITMARSRDDAYTPGPPDLVADLQSRSLDVLAAQYGRLAVHPHYPDPVIFYPTAASAASVRSSAASEPASAASEQAR